MLSSDRMVRGWVLLLGVFVASAEAAEVGTTAGNFLVTPDGAGSYTLPIQVPPGLGQAVPKLAVQFDSKAPYGPLGMRFSLAGLSQIARCNSNVAEDGLVYDPVDFDSFDRFCLDGQKLVSSNYGASGAEYRTLVESFNKIESVGNGSGSTSFDPQYFVVRSKAGATLLYGSTTDSRVTQIRPGAAESTRRAHRWLLSRVTDAAGNYMEFAYLKDEANGEIVPQEIRYSGNSAAGITPHAKVVFSYRMAQGRRPAGYFLGAARNQNLVLEKIETFFEGIAVRRYILSYTLAGTPERERLTSVQECAGTACLNPTTFSWASYSDGLNFTVNQYYPSAAAAWKHFIGDWDADGRQDVVALNQLSSSLKIVVLRPRVDGSGFDTLGPTTVSAPTDSGDWTQLVSDFNGDGRADIALVRNYGGGATGSTDIHFWFSNGSSTPAYAAAGVNTQSIGLTDTDKFAGDVNGDGIRDIVLFHSSTANGVRIQSFVSNGAGGVTASPVAIFDTTLPVDYQQKRFGDMNDDGLLDLVLVHVSSTSGLLVKTYLNDGNGAFRREDATALETSLAGDWQAVIGDINGDGNGDVVMASNANSSSPRTLNVYLGKGDGQYWRSFSGSWDLGSYPFGQPKIADFNGDGLTDLGWVSYLGPYPYYAPHLVGGLMDVFLGTANGQLVRGARASYSNGVLHHFHPDNAQFLFGDVNGDAESDFIALRVRAYDDANDRIQAFTAAAGSPSTVSGITNGLGFSVSMVYKPFTDASVRSGSSGCGGYPVRLLCTPMQVVSEHTESNEPFAARRFTRQYKDFRLDVRGYGLMGPAEAVLTDVDRNIKETTLYQQAFPYIGLPTRQTVARASDQVAVMETITQYASKTLTEAGRTSHFPFAETITERKYEIPPYAKVVSSRVTMNSYGDDYGNLTARSISVYAGMELLSAPFTTDTVDSFASDPYTWRFHKLRTELTRQAPGGTAITRTTAYEYYPFNGLLAAEITEPESPTLMLRTDYGRDAFGNVTSTRVSGPDIAARVTCHEFDPGYPNYGRFSTRTVRRTSGDACGGYGAADHSESRGFDPGTGSLLSATDANNLTSSFGYDALGRARLYSFSQGGIATSKETQRLWCTQVSGVCTDSRDVYVIRTFGASGEDAYRILDKFERETGRMAKTGNGQFTTVRQEYDRVGNVSRRASPRMSGGGAYWTTYSYDLLNRVLVEDAPASQSTTSGRLMRHEYDGLVVRRIDAQNRRWVQEMNAVGNVTSTRDPGQGRITFAYDAFDNVTAIQDAGGSLKTMLYDTRGRKYDMTDPDMGHWTYGLNVLGEVIAQQDGKGQVSQFSYDSLGRMVGRNEPAGQTTWTFDTAWKGALTEVSAPGYRRSYTYTAFGAPQRETIEIEVASAPPGQPTITQFSANPGTINQGQSTLLSWATTDALSCTAGGSLPGWSGSKSANGSQSLTVTSQGTFQAILSCVNKYGQSTSASVNVTVNYSPPVQVHYFGANPSPVDEDRYTTLSWGTSYAVSCTGSGTLPGWPGTKPVNSSQSLMVDEPGQYSATLTCRDVLNRTATRTITLQVNDCLVPLQTCVAPPVPLPVTSPLPDELPVDPTAEIEALIGALCAEYPDICAGQVPADPVGMLTSILCRKYPDVCQTIPPPPDGNELCEVSPYLCVAPPSEPPVWLLQLILQIVADPCGRHTVGTLTLDLGPVCATLPEPPPLQPVWLLDLLQQIVADPCGRHAVGSVVVDLGPVCASIPQPPPTQPPVWVLELVQGIVADPCGRHTIGSVTTIDLGPVCASVPEPPPTQPAWLVQLLQQILADPCARHPIGPVTLDLQKYCNAVPEPPVVDPIGDAREFLNSVRDNPCGAHEFGTLSINMRPICDSLPAPPLDAVITTRQASGVTADAPLDELSRVVLSFQDLATASQDVLGASLVDVQLPAPALTMPMQASVPPSSGGGSQVPGYSYAYLYTYDALGRTSEITYPSGLKVRNGYNASGALATVTNVSSGLVYWEALDWNAWGQVRQSRLGNGVQTTRATDAAVGFLQSISSGVGGGTGVQSLTYGWNTFGNVTFRQDGNQASREDFTYDSLDRVGAATFAGSAGTFQSLSNTYAANGNVTYKDAQYVYGTKPHAVAAVGTASYSYDANGNLVSGGGRTYTWASYNLPLRIDYGANHADFIYGPERQRVRQLYETAQEGRLIYYVGALYEEHRRGTAVEAKHYISTGEGIVAVETWAGTARTEYFHRDHLGSIDTVTNASGQVVQRLSYDAFGRRRASTGQALPAGSTFATSRGYTGHEHLDSVGLIHMNGRVYDPGLGRFVSADPHVPDPYNSQSHNRYSYAVNNPLNRVDPTGFDETNNFYFDPSGWAVDGYTDPSGFGLIIRGRYMGPFGFDPGSLPFDFEPPLAMPDWVAPLQGISGAGFLDASFSYTAGLSGQIPPSFEDRVTVDKSVNEAAGTHRYQIRGYICSQGMAACNGHLADRIFRDVNKNDVPLSYRDSGSGMKTLFPMQPVYHSENVQLRTSVNVTVKGHLFHPGDVTHRVHFAGGVLYYDVVGTGSGSLAGFNNWFGVFLFESGVEDIVEKYSGP